VEGWGRLTIFEGTLFSPKSGNGNWQQSPRAHALLFPPSQYREHQFLALFRLVLMPALPPSTSGRLCLARPHLLPMLLLLTAFLATATSASAIDHRQMQAAATEEDVAITVDYDRSHGYDVGGPAPICWRRVNNIDSRAAACPAELIMTFSDPPPNPLFSMRDYISYFRVTVNGAALGLTSLDSSGTGLQHEITHANVHSCVATVGFCSPFIGNTPGLSTHSPEKVLMLPFFFPFSLPLPMRTCMCRTFV